MKYLFYTSDGYTESPNGNTVENLQVLGEAEGCSVNEAYNKLVENNDWIVSGDFTPENTYYKMIVTQEIISHIQTVIDYLWKDEKKHYEEEGAEEKNHIFSYLKNVSKYFNLNITEEAFD